MAISWRHIKDAEQPTRQSAADLEQTLIGSAASMVRHAAADGVAGSWWRLNGLRTRTRQLVQRFVTGAARSARAAVTAAATTGRAEAERDLRRRHLTVLPTHSDIPVAEAAQAEVTDRIHATARTAIRSGDRLYEEALSAIVATPAQSEAHRLRVAQGVLDRLGEAGITGFVDRANRRWNLVSYVEMVTKATAANAMLDSHVRTLADHGRHLVVIDGAVDCCAVCAPWHGRIVGIDSPASLGGATLADARAAGVWHPHCRCSIGCWTEGDPLPAVPEPDPQLYRDRQRLRALERQVRASKRMRAAAVTPEALTDANRRIRAAQKQIREHVAATQVRRQRRREQIGRAL